MPIIGWDLCVGPNLYAGCTRQEADETAKRFTDESTGIEFIAIKFSPVSERKHGFHRTCPDCTHRLENNDNHTFDKNDAYIDKHGYLTHSGKCVNCIECQSKD
jgi:hypothetical protein